ncbi:hypothetical protein [Dactylosporangium sp. CA-233914]|uniref:hypothetical protein n=1 Tax=Dactylosporangium sp. CA-233914 TaxID=3239934 RepID=UPI003D8BFDB6
MGARTLALAPGMTLLMDGEIVEVFALEGTRVTLRNERTSAARTVGLTALISAARSLFEPAASDAPVGVVLATLTAKQRREVAERAGHVREMLTGFRSGRADRPPPGEPDPRFAQDVPLRQRYASKASELGVGIRTLERWVSGYREAGEAGLVSVVRGGPTQVDPRWDEAVRWVLAELVDASTPTRSAVIARVAARVEELHGAGVVRLPSTAATAYRWLAELTRARTRCRAARRAAGRLLTGRRESMAGCGRPGPAST